MSFKNKHSKLALKKFKSSIKLLSSKFSDIGSSSTYLRTLFTFLAFLAALPLFLGLNFKSFFLISDLKAWRICNNLKFSVKRHICLSFLLEWFKCSCALIDIRLSSCIDWPVFFLTVFFFFCFLFFVFFFFLKDFCASSFSSDLFSFNYSSNFVHAFTSKLLVINS